MGSHTTTIYFLKPEIGHQSSQIHYLSEQSWYFLKIEDNSSELLTPGSKILPPPPSKKSHRYEVLQKVDSATEPFLHKQSHFSPPLLTDQGHTIFKWISTERSVVHRTKYHNWVKKENKIYSEEYLCAWLTHSSLSLISPTWKAR